MEVHVADHHAVLATNDRAEEPRADARVRRQLIAPEPDETRRLARKVRRHVVVGEPADLGAVFAEQRLENVLRHEDQVKPRTRYGRANGYWRRLTVRSKSSSERRRGRPVPP